jgi:hypothetical protein
MHQPYTDDEFRQFLDAYIEAALWSSTDNSREDGGDPLDENYGPEDLAPETLAEMREQCADFLAHNVADIRQAGTFGTYARIAEHTAFELAGHDFWLNRNGHGAGFWDRDLGTVGERLDRESEVYGGVDLTVGDDGKIHA